MQFLDFLTKIRPKYDHFWQKGVLVGVLGVLVGIHGVLVGILGVLVGILGVLVDILGVLVGVLGVLVGAFLYRDGILGVFGIGMVYLLHEMEHLVFGMVYLVFSSQKMLGFVSIFSGKTLL